jgi:hypothetical protein
MSTCYMPTCKRTLDLFAVKKILLVVYTLPANPLTSSGLFYLGCERLRQQFFSQYVKERTLLYSLIVISKMALCLPWEKSIANSFYVNFTPMETKIANSTFYIQVSQNWRTNYLLSTLSRMFKCTYVKKIWKKNFRQKNLLLLLLLLTVTQWKQRYTCTSLPYNVTVVDLK